MQAKFNKYTEELNAIVVKLNNVPSIQNISIKELRQYKNLISRKDFLQKKINAMLSKRANIIGNYNDKNKIWLISDINCRKYHKLEQSAAYSRDRALYKLGFLDSKPILPLFQNIKDFISEKIFLPLSDKSSELKDKLTSNFNSISQKSPICKGIRKSKNFIQNDLPISLTNLAISETKKCIISYRKFSNSLKLFSRNISSSPSIRTLSYIINRAKQEADLEQNSFLGRIKVDPTTFEYYNKDAVQNGYFGTGEQVSPSHLGNQNNSHRSKLTSYSANHNFNTSR